MQNNNLEELLRKLKRDYPGIEFASGEDFMWAPDSQTVYYSAKSDATFGALSLLHETSHAILGHRRYNSDMGLLHLELAAWQHAKKLAEPYATKIDNEHIEDCMDTYRNWLHGRSLCPHCNLSGMQLDATTYTCTFCHQEWHVSSARFCRPYRKKI